MTDMDVILQKLNTIEDVQKTQGADIKDLTKGFTLMAEQQKDIAHLNQQTTTLWKKYDSLTGPDSTMESIREHQKHCPKEEMHRTFAWVWKILSVHSGLIVMLFGWFIYSVTK